MSHKRSVFSDNNVLYQRQEAMLAARLKMQEKQNQLSEEFMKQAKEVA